MEEEPWFTGPQYRIIATFRNTRKHTGDGVEIPATHGASSTKGTNRSVGFVWSSVPGSTVAHFGSSPAILANCAFEPCSHASPLQIRLHSARKTTTTNTSSSNYDFLLLGTTVPGTLYTPDLGTMLPQQRANFTGRREFIVISRTQLRTGLTPAFHCDFQCIRISHNDKRMGRYSITDKLASSLLSSLFSRLINTVTITGNVSSIMIALKILKLCLINVPMTHMLRCRLSNHI
jgi:hypothetical protein